MLLTVFVACFLRGASSTPGWPGGIVELLKSDSAYTMRVVIAGFALRELLAFRAINSLLFRIGHLNSTDGVPGLTSRAERFECLRNISAVPAIRPVALFGFFLSAGISCRVLFLSAVISMGRFAFIATKAVPGLSTASFAQPFVAVVGFLTPETKPFDSF